MAVRAFFNKNLLILFTLFLIVVKTSFAQAPAEVLTNASIIQLKKAGLSATVIKTKIAASACNFNTDTNALIDLKNAKVDDDIIDAMIKKGTVQGTTPVAASAIPKEKWGKMDGDNTYITTTGVKYRVGQKITLGTMETGEFSSIIKFSPFGYSPDDTEHLGTSMSRKDVTITKILTPKKSNTVYLIIVSGGKWGIDIEKALAAKEVSY